MKTVYNIYYDSFHFGLHTCANCLDFCDSKYLIRRKVFKPVIGIDNEVLIPAGFQMFHYGCYQQLKEFA